MDCGLHYSLPHKTPSRNKMRQEGKERPVDEDRASEAGEKVAGRVVSPIGVDGRHNNQICRSLTVHRLFGVPSASRSRGDEVLPHNPR